jgi:hypothetical protein
MRTTEQMAKSQLLSSISLIVVKNPKSEIQNRSRGVPERYVAGGACPEPVEGTPEDARLPARLRPVGDYAPEGRAYSSERRAAISEVAVTPRREFMKYPG